MATLSFPKTTRRIFMSSLQRLHLQWAAEMRAPSGRPVPAESKRAVLATHARMRAMGFAGGAK